MKVYITSIGELTTKICKWQFERLGFDVVLLDKIEPWLEKYKSFINTAKGNCLRCDADTIINKNILNFNYKNFPEYLMITFQGYDFYKNNIGSITPIFYRKEALEIIKNKIDKLDCNRPETSAWRFPEIVEKTLTLDMIVGFHGFFQDSITFNRAIKNKVERKQFENYDFELAKKLNDTFYTIKF
jgi:hypothetical protein